MGNEAIITAQAVMIDPLAFWSTIAAAVSALIAAVAAGISLWQAWEFRKQITEDSRLKKIQRTIELGPNYSDEYIRCSKYIFLKIPDVINGHLSDDALGKIKEDVELMGAIAQVLHFWARFAICYYEGMLDFKVAKMSCRGGFYR